MPEPKSLLAQVDELTDFALGSGDVQLQSLARQLRVSFRATLLTMLEHKDHVIDIGTDGREATPEHVAVECNTCGVVLLGEGQEPWFSGGGGS